MLPWGNAAQRQGKFVNNGVVAFLEDQPFSAIILLTIRGETGGSRVLLKGRRSSRTTYTRTSQTYGEQTFTVYSLQVQRGALLTTWH